MEKMVIIFLLGLAVIFGILIHNSRIQPMESMLTPDEAKWVLGELHRLNADACVLEKDFYGWKCTAAYDRVYKVYPKGCGIREKKYDSKNK